MKVSTYQGYTELPGFEKVTFQDGKPQATATTLPRWSGTAEPPPLGSCVNVTMNAIGPAQVIGYFSQAGWIGLIVKPYTPPAWFIKQNGYDAQGHVFGAEIAPEPIPAPELAGPNQAQLAALQRYANGRGRSWKRELSLAWSTGADAREEDGHLLRQVRNQHGPGWLHSRNNPIKPMTR